MVRTSLTLTRQGLTWLKAELADVVRLAGGGPQDRSAARRSLLAWEKLRALQEDADLDRLRAEAKALLQSLGGSSEP